MEEKEIWQLAEGMNGRVEVSNTGKVRSLPFTTIRSNGRVINTKGVVYKQNAGKRGYYTVWFRPVLKTMAVHRLVAKAFVANPNNYKEVNHIDGNKLNNNATNLEWCDRQQNITHARVNGLYKKRQGETTSNCRLTELEVKEIKLMRESGATYKKIGEKYNISLSNAQSIYKGRIWKHVA